MKEIARTSGYRLSRTTLKHIKSFLSGVFTFACRQGVINTANPMQGVSIPRGAEPIDTHAYSLEEITAMLAVLEGLLASSQQPRSPGCGARRSGD
jgi:hypothetical protein